MTGGRVASTACSAYDLAEAAPDTSHWPRASRLGGMPEFV
jgi:hypothetical protein